MFFFALAIFSFSASAQASIRSACRIFLIPGAFHGSSLSARFFLSEEDYFRDYREFFAAQGCEMGRAQFPADATIEERAMVLRDQVGRFRSGVSAPVVLIAHSQGGLDARFALKTLKLKGVSALITIGVPHHGTELAHWVKRQRESRSLIYWIFRTGGYDLDALSFAGEMTPGFLREKASYFEAISGVHYASARGRCDSGCHWALRALAWWVEIPPGDGLMSVDSQRFGDDLGLYNLDHISEVGADPARLQANAERRRFLERAFEYLKASGSIGVGTGGVF